jgi:hypothetical protein
MCALGLCRCALLDCRRGTRHDETVDAPVTDLGSTKHAALLRARFSLVAVCLIALASGFFGWYARDRSGPPARLPEHEVLGTVSSVDATGLCLQPDDAKTPTTCASTIALSPQRFAVSIGTRMLGSYSVFPSGDKGAGVFMWVTLQPTG